MKDELAVYRQCVADFRALVARFPQLMVPANQARFSSYMRKQMSTQVNDVCKQMHTQGDVMPPKDYRTMGEDLVNIAVRIPASVMGEIDAHVERLRAASRWAKVGRSDAIRDLILRALDSLATPVSVSPQPMPPAVSPQPEPTIAPGAGDNSEPIETIIATPENNYYEQIEAVLLVPENISEPIETIPTPEENISRQIEIVPDQSDTVPAYDTTKFYLGKLCPKGHDFGGTGQSLLRNHNQRCRECENEGRREKRAREKTERDAQPVQS